MMVVFGMSCFIAAPIVNKFGPKACLIMSSLSITIYASPYILITLKSEIATEFWFFSDWLIFAYIYIAAALAGFGKALFWVATSDYVNTCASKNN